MFTLVQLLGLEIRILPETSSTAKQHPKKKIHGKTRREEKRDTLNNNQPPWGWRYWLVVFKLVKCWPMFSQCYVKFSFWIFSPFLPILCCCYIPWEQYWSRRKLNKNFALKRDTTIEATKVKPKLLLLALPKIMNSDKKKNIYIYIFSAWSWLADRKWGKKQLLISAWDLTPREKKKRKKPRPSVVRIPNKTTTQLTCTTNLSTNSNSGPGVCAWRSIFGYSFHIYMKKANNLNGVK